MVGERFWRNLASHHGILYGPQEHHHAGPIGVMPIDVVEHLLPGVDQGIERADALVADPDPGKTCPAGWLHHSERRNEPARVDAAVGYRTAVSIARQVVE